MENLHA